MGVVINPNATNLFAETEKQLEGKHSFAVDCRTGGVDCRTVAVGLSTAALDCRTVAVGLSTVAVDFRTVAVG